MRSLDEITAEEVRDLLGKGWLTHDGAWFFNTANEFGIEVANRLNKAAIKTMAPMEMHRTKKVLGLDHPEIESFDEMVEFTSKALHLIMPASVSSRFHLTAPEFNVIRWDWDKGQCFAYKGMMQIGLLDDYECGVLYRLECWLEALGVTFEIEPRPAACIMHSTGECTGEFRFFFEALAK